MTARPTSPRPAPLRTDGDIAMLALEGVAMAVFSVDGRTMLWGTPASLMLLGYEPWEGYPRVIEPGPLQTKLKQLGRGEAPIEGFLTERMRLPGQRFGTVTLAFRLIALPYETPAILLVAEHLSGALADLSPAIFVPAEPEHPKPSTIRPVLAPKPQSQPVVQEPVVQGPVVQDTIVAVTVVTEVTQMEIQETASVKPTPAVEADIPTTTPEELQTPAPAPTAPDVPAIAETKDADQAKDARFEDDAAEVVHRQSPPEEKKKKRPVPSEDAKARAERLKPLAARSEIPRIRFNWQTDPAGRFSPLPEPARGMLFPSSVRIEGRTMLEVDDRSIVEETGEILAAFSWRNTFTAVKTRWQSDGRWIDVRLSGTPFNRPDGTFGGFRGFGVLMGVSPAPVRPTPFEENSPPQEEEREASTEGKITPAPVSAKPVQAPPAQTRPEPVRPEPPRPEPAAPPSPMGKLSESERLAFREIARALGAREPEHKEQQPSAPKSDETDSNDDEPAPRILPQIDPQRAVVQPLQQERDDFVSTQPAPAPIQVVPPQPAEWNETRPSSATVVDEDPLRDSERLQDLLDRLPIGILLSRGDVPIFMNKTLLELIGYSDADQFHAEGAIDTLFSARVEGDGEHEAMSVRRRNGEHVPMHVRLQTVEWAGLPASLMTFSLVPNTEAMDSTLNRVAELERELATQEAQIAELSTILDTATDGVLVLDKSGRILAGNLTAEALFGYEASEMVGESVLTVLAPESHAQARDYLDALNSHGVASVLNDGREVIGRVRQGGSMPLFMTMGRISDGSDPKFCAVLRDITAWKQAEMELTASKQEAEHASAQKSDVLTKISHELRTPLSAIMGFAEVMMEERLGPVANDRYKEYLRDIHNSGQHVLSLVNDLLDLAKIEAGKFDLDFEAIDLNEIVAGAVSLIQPQAARGKVVVRVGLMPSLPQVVADARSLRQIILNLLSNAVKFTEAGGQVIVATTMTDTGEVVLRVRDTGIGMDETDIEAALEPFRQTRAGRKAGGTGLGLPLTKALAEANRARFTIRSAREAGTLVEITFPTTRVLAS